ncbi:MAG: class I SAM-dependent methyltransferase [Thermoproteota archaeon]
MSKKSVCIRVPKIQGEKTIKLAKKLEIADRTLKIQRDESFLYIPLSHPPQENELQTLKGQIPGLELSTHTFPERKKQPDTLPELLEDRIPSPLLSNLPSAIDFIGDIAVVRIPPELDAYKNVIGKAILNLHKNVRTVMAKAGAVSGTHRIRDLELIAGEPNTETVHTEYGCRYYVDVAEAYFSPRLSFEHNRVASLVQEGETIVDFFTGVGPFPILIAKTHEDVEIYAIDVNPRAVEFLKKNIVLNRVKDKVYPILGDAEKIVYQKLSGVADRVIMNLPEKAMHFVDSSCKALKPEGGIVHLYSFVNTSYTINDLKTKFKQEVERERRTVEKFLSSRIVRGTAPYEWQAVLDALIR